MATPTRTAGADESGTAPAGRFARWVPWAVLGVLLATVAQRAVGALSDLPQFAGKGFGARLAVYPVLVLLVPLVAVVRRARRNHRHVPSGPLPWAATLLVALPFLIDVTGNTLDLYDAVAWWDDANHLVNWALLSGGAGLLLRDGGVRPRWALALCTAGVGALLAVGWELGEWATFVRFAQADGGLAAAYATPSVTLPWDAWGRRWQVSSSPGEWRRCRPSRALTPLRHRPSAPGPPAVIGARVVTGAPASAAPPAAAGRAVRSAVDGRHGPPLLSSTPLRHARMAP